MSHPSLGTESLWQMPQACTNDPHRSGPWLRDRPLYDREGAFRAGGLCDTLYGHGCFLRDPTSCRLPSRVANRPSCIGGDPWQSAGRLGSLRANSLHLRSELRQAFEVVMPRPELCRDKEKRPFSASPRLFRPCTARRHRPRAQTRCQRVLSELFWPSPLRQSSCPIRSITARFFGMAPAKTASVIIGRRFDPKSGPPQHIEMASPGCRGRGRSGPTAGRSSWCCRSPSRPARSPKGRRSGSGPSSDSRSACWRRPAKRRESAHRGMIANRSIGVMTGRRGRMLVHPGGATRSRDRRQVFKAGSPTPRPRGVRNPRACRRRPGRPRTARARPRPPLRGSGASPPRHPGA